MKNTYLEAGKITNTHGVGGDVTAESYCSTPKQLACLPNLYLRSGEEYRRLVVRKASVFKGRVIFGFEGFDSIEQAVKLKNRIIYADRKDIPLKEGEHFIADIIGLPVYDSDTSECYGTISDVLNYGASDIYEITKKDGKKAYVPVVGQFVKKVDTDDGVYISVIEGLI